MNKTQLRFLEKAILGRDIDFNNIDSIIEACVSNSCGDMMTGGRYCLEKGSKERIKLEAIKIIKNNQFKFSIDLINDLSEKIFPKHPSSSYICNKGNRKYSSFGLAQKVINMSFKHFYVFNEYFIKAGITIDYSKCHCPLDSNVLNINNKKLYNPLPSKIFNRLKWTNITEEDYSLVQKEINYILNSDITVKTIISKMNTGINGNLDYDFYIW